MYGPFQNSLPLSRVLFTKITVGSYETGRQEHTGRFIISTSVHLLDVGKELYEIGFMYYANHIWLTNSWSGSLSWSLDNEEMDQLFGTQMWIACA